MRLSSKPLTLKLSNPRRKDGHMKNAGIQTLAVIATCATLLSGGTVAVASEPVPGAVPESTVSISRQEENQLLRQLSEEERSEFIAAMASANVSSATQYEILQILTDRENKPMTRGAVGNVAKALKIAAKIFRGAKWLGKLSGFLQKPENWAANKIERFLRQQGVNANTAHTVAKLLASILI